MPEASKPHSITNNTEPPSKPYANPKIQITLEEKNIRSHSTLIRPVKPQQALPLAGADIRMDIGIDMKC